MTDVTAGVGLVVVLGTPWGSSWDAQRLGADHCFATSAEGTFERLAESFDLIINTVSATIDVNAYLGLLTVDGALVDVGAPAEPLDVDVFPLITGRRSFAGSQIGGIAETQEVLAFCAEHGLASDVELIPADQVDEAYERVLASDVRHRFVIDAATLA